MQSGTAAPTNSIAENAVASKCESIANGRPAVSWRHREMTDNRNVRTFAELNRYAIVKGAVPVYRVWLILRWLDRDGSGVVDRHQLSEALRLLGLTAAHLRHAQAVQTALYGADVFYTSHSDKIEYRSLEAVCAALGVMPGRSVYVPIDGCKSVTAFAAALYTAWHSADTRMISRARLAEMFGVNERTLRRWEKKTKLVNIESNVVEVDDDDVDLALDQITDDDRPHKDEAPLRGYVFRRDGRLYYRTVNTFRGQYAAGNRGRVHKATKRVNAAGGVKFGAAEKPERVFFDALSCKMLAKRELVPVPCVMADEHKRTVKVQHGDAQVWKFSRQRPGKKSKNVT